MTESSSTPRERPGDRSEAQGLLDQLTSWTRDAGVDPVAVTSDTYRSTGESNAAIDDLKEKLAALGVSYRWNPNTQAYESDPPQV